MLNFLNAGQHIAIIGGKDTQGDYVREVEVVRISDDGVVSPSTCQLPDLQVAYAAISGNLICGGENPDRTNECQELSPEGMKWKERSPMKKKRFVHAMTDANNLKYVCGGIDEHNVSGPYDLEGYLKSCEKLNGEWSFIKDLPIPLCSHCMIGTEEFIYSIGGLDGSVFDGEVN